MRVREQPHPALLGGTAGVVHPQVAPVVGPQLHRLGQVPMAVEHQVAAAVREPQQPVPERQLLRVGEAEQRPINDLQIAAAAWSRSGESPRWRSETWARIWVGMLRTVWVP